MLVNKKHRAVVLNLKYPDRVTTLIPTAKKLQHKGRTLVAVPHRIDEVKILKNLGIEVPPPISSYYEWSGMFEPFEHQRVM